MPLAIRALAFALLPCALACTREAPANAFPGLDLLARVEARLAKERLALAPMLEHYALVFPVEPADLDAFVGSVRVHGHGPDLALGDERGLEAHGGGVLRLLFEHWRPGGALARLAEQAERGLLAAPDAQRPERRHADAPLRARAERAAVARGGERSPCSLGLRT